METNLHKRKFNAVLLLGISKSDVEKRNFHLMLNELIRIMKYKSKIGNVCYSMYDQIGCY
jgi:hypothetical protein